MSDEEQEPLTPQAALDQKYMKLALEQAELAAQIGEVPIGAVVVCDGEVVAERLTAIEKLDTLMHDPKSIEKRFQELLGENPWMVNPAWQPLGGSISDSFSASREEFYKLYNARTNKLKGKTRRSEG